MAVVLPLLLTLVAGIVDFGFLLQSFEVVTNAAREGARIRVLPGYTNQDAIDRVASYVTASGLPGTPSTVVSPLTITPGGGSPFPAVQVSVSYTYQFAMLRPIAVLFGRTFPVNKTFTATSVMRVELPS
jgi:Flp pilus assembly protein TadG